MCSVVLVQLLCCIKRIKSQASFFPENNSPCKCVSPLDWHWRLPARSPTPAPRPAPAARPRHPPYIMYNCGSPSPCMLFDGTLQTLTLCQKRFFIQIPPPLQGCQRLFAIPILKWRASSICTRTGIYHGRPSPGRPALERHRPPLRSLQPLPRADNFFIHFHAHVGPSGPRGRCVELCPRYKREKARNK